METFNSHDFFITLDLDWAPDFMIDFAAEALIAAGVRATWFITHASPAVARLRCRPDLFELGIHPNFKAGSTHGNTPQEVLEHCLSIVPEAVSMRTHSLVQSDPLLFQIASQTPIKIDVSLYLPRMPHISPVIHCWQGYRLLRVPFFWEDDSEVECGQPDWQLAGLLQCGTGLKVLNFHPIHVYLNTADMATYYALTRTKQMPGLTPDEIEPFINPGKGVRSLFLEVVEYLGRVGDSRRICDLL